MIPELAGSWIDASRPVDAATPVWPGDRPVEPTTAEVDGLVVSAIATTCHVGTHLDAPRHLDPAAAAVDEVPLERLLGAAEVVATDARLVDVGDLPGGWVPRAPRLLLRTDSHPVGAPIDGRFAAVTPELVAWLADRGVVTLGIDTPSVDPFDAVELAAHRALLERDMTWLEGLWLGDAAPGLYLMFALPLRLVGLDAAPARVVLRPLSAAAGGEDP